MTNVVAELESVPSTVPYEASYPTQDNLAADWSGDTRLYLDALPLEPALIDVERQKLELDITQEFEFADGEATLLIDETK